MNKALEILSEMTEQRGYKREEDEEEFHSPNGGNTDLFFYRKKNGEKMVLFKNLVEKLNIAELKNCIGIMTKLEIKHCIIVHEGQTTPAVRTVIEKSPEIGLIIELFNVGDLQFNITKHILVPKHEVLEEKEAKIFKKKYGSNIPVLLKSDPISRFYDFRRGDVVRITRKSGVIAYRIVR